MDVYHSLQPTFPVSVEALIAPAAPDRVVCFEFGEFMKSTIDSRVHWVDVLPYELWRRFYDIVHQPPFEDVTPTPGKWEKSCRYYVDTTPGSIGSHEQVIIDYTPPKDRNSNKVNYNIRRVIHDTSRDRFFFHEGTGQCVRMCLRDVVVHLDKKIIKPSYSKRMIIDRRVFRLVHDGVVFDHVFEKLVERRASAHPQDPEIQLHRLEIRTIRTPTAVGSAFEKLIDLIGREFMPLSLHYNTQFMSNEFFTRQIMAMNERRTAALLQQQQQQQET